MGLLKKKRHFGKRIYAQGFTRHTRMKKDLVHITIHYMHEVVFSQSLYTRGQRLTSTCTEQPQHAIVQSRLKVLIRTVTNGKFTCAYSAHYTHQVDALCRTFWMGLDH